MLDKAWTPMYNASGVLLTIQILLSDPNADSPANTQAAILFKEHREEYDEKVKECVENSLINYNNYS